MIKFNNDIFFTFIYSCCLYYIPTKANKKQIKNLFYSFPFFLNNIKNKKIIFETIKTIPITSYYDTNESMIDYSYIIYKEYHKKIKKRFLLKKDYIQYYNSLLIDQKEYNMYFYKKKLNNIMFFILILIFFYFIYAY